MLALLALLQLARAEDDTIVVDGTRPSPDGASTVIAADTILGDDLGSALDAVPGTTVRRLGGLGDFTAVSIRGSSFQQVELTLDGIPLNPDGGHVVNLAEWPIAGLSRIEVWRGSAPADLGSAPIGGVVALSSASRGSAVEAGGGSYGSLRLSGLHTGSTRGANPWTLSGSADWFSTEGDFAYLDDGGTRFATEDDGVGVRANNDKAQLSGLVRASGDAGPLHVAILDAVLTRDEGVAGPIGYPAATARLATTRNLLGARIDAGGASAIAWASARQEQLDDPRGETGVNPRRYRTTTLQSGIRATGRKAWDPLELTASAEVRYERLGGRDLLTDDPGTHAGRVAAVGSASANLTPGPLGIQPVLVFEHVADRVDGLAWGGVPGSPKAPNDFLAPRLTVWCDLAPWARVRAFGGRYFRPPSLDERYGDSGASHGNQGLVAERGTSADLALQVFGDRGSLSIDGYWRESVDLIVWVQNGQRTLIPVNIGRARVRGLELAGEQRFERLTVRLSANLTDARNRTDQPAYFGKALPRIPLAEVEEAVALDVHPRVRIAQTWSFAAGNWWDATNWYQAPPRSLVGAFVTIKPADRLSVQLEALNLLDADTAQVLRDPLSNDGAKVDAPLTDFSGYPLPGRTFMLSVGWKR